MLEPDAVNCPHCAARIRIFDDEMRSWDRCVKCGKSMSYSINQESLDNDPVNQAARTEKIQERIREPEYKSSEAEKGYSEATGESLDDQEGQKSDQPNVNSKPAKASSNLLKLMPLLLLLIAWGVGFAFYRAAENSDNRISSSKHATQVNHDNIEADKRTRTAKATLSESERLEALKYKKFIHEVYAYYFLGRIALYEIHEQSKRAPSFSNVSYALDTYDHFYEYYSEFREVQVPPIYSDFFKHSVDAWEFTLRACESLARYNRTRLDRHLDNASYYYDQCDQSLNKALQEKERIAALLKRD